MNKSMILIWALIIGVAVISSVIKKLKKAANTGSSAQKKTVTNYNQPTTNTYQKPKHIQPKSLEDILDQLLNPHQTPVKKAVEQKIEADKQPIKFTSLESSESLETIDEKKYYELDTELDYNKEMEDYDKPVDHHVHGAGFDPIKEETVVEEEGEWAHIDWRKAVISAEILRRPEY
jgi:hypothetical protein